jgi:hypothetical protein
MRKGRNRWRVATSVERAWSLQYNEKKSNYRSGEKKKGGVGRNRTARLTRCRKRVVVSAQAQEEEERGEPDADREKRGHLSERGRSGDGSAAVGVLSGIMRLMREAGEVEEPEEVVNDDEDAGGDEGLGGERDERPGVGEIL